MKNQFSDRKYIVNLIIISIGVIFILRLFYIQIIDDRYKISSQNNSQRIITVYPGRGLIYDRFDKMLVYNEATYDLMVIPKQVKNIDTAMFCKLVRIDKETFEKNMDKAIAISRYKSSIFEKQISKEMYGYLQENLYKFHGFFVQSRTLRKYPLPIAAHMLGYVGEVDQNAINKNKYYAQSDYIGISGLEKAYEEELRGRKGVRITMVDVLNREKGSFANGKYDTSAVLGKNLYTSIDRDLQEYGELLMQNKRGSIVAIEPSTGEILAIVSAPSYDPNLLVGRYRAENYRNLMYDSVKPLFNRALMAMYPPGSTFKLANALIGQQLGVLFPSTIYTCARGFHFGGLTVACHEHPPSLDLMGSIENSCNNYYCRVFMSILNNPSIHNTSEAYNIWRNYILSFGFGTKFNSDLPYETRGNIPSSAYYDKLHGKNRWNAISIISLAIGQGEVLATPMQMANFVSMVANRGYYMTPHIVRAIGDKNNLNVKISIKKYTPAIDRKYYDIVIEGMYEVVEHGTGVGARLDSIKICAKTGTAQNPHGKDHSVFVAFAPMDNPKIAISVLVENAGFGNAWAAPIASLMIEKYLKRKVKRKELEEKMVSGNLLGPTHADRKTKPKKKN